jgi:tetratricopeptide (TPR) repeat protein
VTLSVPAFSRSGLFGAACLGAVLLVFGAYSNSLHNSFHFDDDHTIERNVFIRDLAYTPRYFTDARTFSAIPANAVYRPIVTLTLALDYWLAGGLNPTQFHVTQLTLLVAVGALLVLLYVKVFDSAGEAPWHRWVALFTATLFCIHTGNTQTGNYISARSELLSGIGVLGAFVLYLYAPRSRRRHWYLAPMVVGALAKSPAVMFAPLLLVYKLLIEEQLSVREVFSKRAWPQTRSALRSSLPAFGLGIATFFFIAAMNAPGHNYGGGGRLDYLATQTWVWLRYVRLFFVPTGLSADTDLKLFTTWQDPRVVVGLLLAAALLIVLWRASRSRALRPTAFGLAWFWIALLPTSSIVPLAEVTNDHRVFFPFMGLGAAVVWWVWVRVRRWADSSAASRAAVLSVAWTLGLLILAAHALGTYRRNRVWMSEETLWADVVAKSPMNGRGLMNYGLTQMQRGRLVEAKALFTRAEPLVPTYPVLQVNLGVVYGALGDSVAAEQHFERAIALDSTYAGSHLWYARWLAGHRRAPEAIAHLQRAIALDPGALEARELLMSIYAARGATQQLKALARETLGFASAGTTASLYARDSLPFAVTNPGYEGLFQLGLSFTRDRRHVEAAQAYRAALAFTPDSADAWNNLGWSLAELGFYDEAIPAYENALRLRPGWQRATNNLAAAKTARSSLQFSRAFGLQVAGRLDEAIRIYRELLAEYPRWVNAHYNLGHALMTQGHCAEAVAEFERTLALQPTYPAAHLHLASCLEKLGRPADAARHRAVYEVSTRRPTSATNAGQRTRAP